eukprot:TRINITY_DN8262_c0_g1_i10.p1 TRINITY_DN8262_c0_g1~~TRINITY_DN8262_c0_g1_i10.p1  ORF type:complete len:156 (-),score=32.91 TRINITY_DN8262_c0_g1_i10:203-670(-)
MRWDSATSAFAMKSGNGVAKDLTEAVKWFRLLAEQGDALGQCNLGVCYEIGYGVAKDLKEAVKWYRRSAEQGNAMGRRTTKSQSFEGMKVVEEQFMKNKQKHKPVAASVWPRISRQERMPEDSETPTAIVFGRPHPRLLECKLERHLRGVVRQPP